MSETALRSAYCILGSNVGRRADMLRRAVFLLAEAPGVELLGASRIWETAPWGKAEQDPYLNAALALRTSLEPTALLDCFQAIERRLGRPARRELWGPRLIDLDIALYGDAQIESPRLTLPHRHLRGRAFALAPLLELAPDLRDPSDGSAYAEALAALPEADRDGVAPREALLAEGPGDWRHCLAADSLLARCARPEDTEALGALLAGRIRGGDRAALTGPLGSGKTCLTRGLARGLGVRGPVASPSYVLVRSYEGERLTLHHADFYRLEAAPSEAGGPPEPPDLASLGLEDYLDDPEALLWVEWADHFPHWLEPPFWRLSFLGAGDQPRLVLVRRVHEGESD